MADPSISEIKYLGSGTIDFLEVRVPDDYPDPENLRLVIYDRNHNGSTTQSPAASDIHDVTADGLLYTEDADMDGNDDDGLLHYTFGTAENGTTIFLHAQDAVGLYNEVTGETYGLYNWSGVSYTVSTASGDPFAGETATQLDATGQFVGSSLEQQPDGTYALNSNPNPGSSYVCFVSGAKILTPTGERPVESLAVGDVVVTKDFGHQCIRWIGQRHFVDVARKDHAVQPVTIPAHTFGPNVPSRDTKMSPNHAVLANSWKTSLYFGVDEVLTTAKSLIQSGRAHHSTDAEVRYFHILLDQHSLIQADGLWSESLFIGSQSMEMLTQKDQEEVFKLMPDLGGCVEAYGPKVRYALNVKEAEVLA